MFNSIDKWLNNPYIFRYFFFILLSLSIFVNFTLSLNNGNFFILYIISVIFLGIGFYNSSPFFLGLFTFLVVLSRFYSIPDSSPNIVSLFIYFITYLIITFISAILMSYSQKVKLNYIELTSALANALDTRDPNTRNHSENVSKYSLKIAEKMNLPISTCEIIRVGGLLHDIGKIGIPEHILMKPEKLTDEEYNLIKTHPKIGYDMVKHVSNFHDSGILDIILYHHERYDGKGYLMGLKGDEIPLVARIVAVADTFDAMTSNRVYRNNYTLQDTLNEISKYKGTQFDPVVVDAFLSLFQEKKG